MRVIELTDDATILRTRIREIAQLQNGVRLHLGHPLQKCAQAIGAIVHHIVMQIGDHANLDWLLQSLNRGHRPPRQRQHQRRKGGRVEETTPAPAGLPTVVWSEIVIHRN